jgi:hypothetical protein
MLDFSEVQDRNFESKQGRGFKCRRLKSNLNSYSGILAWTPVYILLFFTFNITNLIPMQPRIELVLRALSRKVKQPKSEAESYTFV